ncbi:DUF1707 SHOCT-like domain-containing protein [Actinoplanes utahensis]|uniref:DUF1707 domain-containing protein n=1 Tax=Actinoplanes utahensis TaxID=1869 RepID=A0A0A6UFH8_ACTUT|nr:DUF1707 domain-containing protein [Actinoplanes utahensis]KHD73803.1 hypothetical protein MB27_32685 [Actinoplanes utahensis]GIF27830.1 hypothetical protein Aut01nite_08160 [Actinoplanes utahensis]
MSKEVDTMRAADADRQQIADRLKTALDEGRLSLHEYDERVGAAYAARTYAELMVLVKDLPRPGMTSAEVAAQARRSARRLPTALIVLWTVWGAVTAINVVAYLLVAVTVDLVYPWPLWLLVPGAALGAVTVGTQVIRNQNRKD